MTPFQKGRRSEAVEETLKFEKKQLREKVDTSAPVTLWLPLCSGLSERRKPHVRTRLFSELFVVHVVDAESSHRVPSHLQPRAFQETGIESCLTAGVGGGTGPPCCMVALRAAHGALQCPGSLCPPSSRWGRVQLVPP